MKRAVALVFVLAVAIAGVVIAQRRHEATGVSPNAILNLAADAQRDALRLPMHFTRLSDDEEMQLGNDMAGTVYAQNAYKPTPDLEREVQRIGARLAANAHRKLRYQFHLINDPNFENAFAIPGGHVFIGLGIIHRMDTEDELAGVLAHELEHIDHYHCDERVQLEAQARKLHLEVAADLVQIPLSIFEAGYSKDQESEADREGLLLSAASGYSPYGTVTLFQKFEHEQSIQAASPPEEASQLAEETLNGYFRSHPQTEERVAQAKSVIADHALQSRTKQTPLPPIFEK
jgi:beta-barrel assembly-enhancing protease